MKISVSLQTLSLLSFFACGEVSAQAQQRLFSGLSPNSFVYEDDEEQEDTLQGLSFGLNIGSYFANGETANIYNGSGPFAEDVNAAANVRWYSIPERIGIDGPFAQSNDIREIQNFYNTQTYSFPFDYAPTNMRYNPAMYVGLNLKWNFNRYAAVLMNVNACKLKAVGQFTMQLPPTSQTAQNNVGPTLLSIAGEEQRFNINLGYRQGWMMGDYSNFFVQVGGSMLGTKWMRNYVLVADRQFDLITSSFVAGQTPMSATPNTGVGFGAFVQTGVEFWVGKYSFDIGLGFSRDKVIINTYEQKVTNKWLQATFNI
ncbi:MAG: hypothetical protein ACK478_09235 [Flavobacteriales bacterium]|jgi:hypothetical protein